MTKIQFTGTTNNSLLITGIKEWYNLEEYLRN